MKDNNIYKEEFDLMEINEVEVLFTPLRICKENIPSHLYVYEIRATDDGTNDFATIERNVKVNHTGTIISKIPLMNNEDFVEIEDFGFMGEEMTLTNFLNE